MAPGRIEIFDTTLRDGTQGENFSLSLFDKVRVARKLDELGIDYVEGGWPGSNPLDMAFFREIKKHCLTHAQIVAFGATCHPGSSPDKDENLQMLLSADTGVLAVFGKSWAVQVHDALRTTLKKNLTIIRGSVAFLKGHGKRIIYDAEHFFDGYKADPRYAFSTLEAALEGGATTLVLCDTNGGTLPSEIGAIVAAVRAQFATVALGIHTHNDTDTAVASALAAVEQGAVHVQGTINGVGERCGNANLCSIIPNLRLKLGKSCIHEDQLVHVQVVSALVAELANEPPRHNQPFVGRSAFAHKGGVHVAAVLRNPETYEHIPPELVGNHRRVLISDLSGRSTISHKAQAFGLDLGKDDPIARKVLAEIKARVHEGFQYEAAEASFELLVHRARGLQKSYFQLLGFHVTDSKRSDVEEPQAEASIRVKVGQQEEHTAALGHGPVNALDNALRKALEKHYVNLKEMRLSDYKVRVLPGVDGTGAKVRVLIESTDGVSTWGTVGLSVDILEASWQALTDSYTYKLHKDELKQQQEIPPADSMKCIG